MTISDKNIARFKRATKQLNKVINDCKDESPACFAYLDANENFCLMSGEKGIGEEGDDDTIIATENLKAQGGDW